MILNDHGHAQYLVAVRGDLPGDNIGTAAQAPGLHDLDFLLGPFKGGGFLYDGFLSGGRFLCGSCFLCGRLRTGCQTHSHDKHEDQSHELFHFFLSFYFILTNSG